MKRSLLFCILALYAFTSYAETIVPGGRVSGTWTLVGSPYIVIGNIFVEDSLIIAPGVNVRFDGGWQLEARANARFLCRGSDSAPIVFEPHQGAQGGLWNRIYLNNSGGNDTIEFSEVRYATDGIYSYNSVPTIRTCKIFGSRGTGETGSGIVLYYDCIVSGGASISHCDIYDNKVGIRLWTHRVSFCGPSDTAMISWCALTQNLEQGISITTSGAGSGVSYMLALISNCTIAKNGGSGIGASGTFGNPEAYVLNTILAFNGGYGISNETRGLIDPADVRYNCIFGNALGDFSGISGTGFGRPPLYLNRNDDSCDVSRNIFFNPSFADTANSEYRLRDSLSKSVDAGTNALFSPTAAWDPDSTYPDMGAFDIPHLLRVSLISPKPDSLLQIASFNLVWDPMGNRSVSRYWRQIAADSLFNSIRISDTTTITTRTTGSLNIGAYWWRVKAQTTLGWGPWSVRRRFFVNTTNVIELGAIPAEFSLGQNYPNPFNPSTKIQFAIPSAQDVSLKVFDLLGREVAAVVNEKLQMGNYETTFDGSGVASGVYVYRLHAGQFAATKKLLLLR